MMKQEHSSLLYFARCPLVYCWWCVAILQGLSGSGSGRIKSPYAALFLFFFFPSFYGWPFRCNGQLRKVPLNAHSACAYTSVCPLFSIHRMDLYLIHVTIYTTACWEYWTMYIKYIWIKNHQNMIVCKKRQRKKYK